MPTQYDDDGYPRRYFRHVIPSNSLAVLHGLTLHAAKDERLKGTSIEVHCFDDRVWAERFDYAAGIVRSFSDAHTKVVVGIIGVQTNQFPRAAVIAKACVGAGATVVIGGQHVTGAITTMHDGLHDQRRDKGPLGPVPCPSIMPTEIAELMELGVSFYHGEGETAWTTVLVDAVNGTVQSLYRGDRADLSKAPLPVYPENYFRGFTVRVGTFNTSNGCPFLCSFCVVAITGGKDVRARSPQAVAEMVRAMCEQYGHANFFFTDDNFARNPLWYETLEELIALRRSGHNIHFMIEGDLKLHTIVKNGRRFIDMLSDAGCVQVFLGVESVDPVALKECHKYQNNVDQYRELCRELHERGMTVHAGYIIGFPNHTRDAILDEVFVLQEIGFDIVSFFILTPLPGSEDHVRAYVRGVAMDADLSGYDSFHLVTDHPRMTRQEMVSTLYECFRRFYTRQHMVKQLRALPLPAQMALLMKYIWYRCVAFGDTTHPMNGGFFRLRQRLERRPGMPIESKTTFWTHESSRLLRYALFLVAELFIMQLVVYEALLQPKLGATAHKLEAWFGLSTIRSFWRHYADRGVHLLYRLDLHLVATLAIIAEAVYGLIFAGIMVRHHRYLFHRI